MMMVIRTSEGSMNLLVDKIGMVLDVDSNLFEKPAETLKPAVRDVTLHVCKLDQQLLLVLDAEKIIQLGEFPATQSSPLVPNRDIPAAL
jgi:purine-binding chemotaxis protein CheW